MDNLGNIGYGLCGYIQMRTDEEGSWTYESVFEGVGKLDEEEMNRISEFLSSDEFLGWEQVKERLYRQKWSNNSASGGNLEMVKRNGRWEYEPLGHSSWKSADQLSGLEAELSKIHDDMYQ